MNRLKAQCGKELANQIVMREKNKDAMMEANGGDSLVAQ